MHCLWEEVIGNVLFNAVAKVCVENLCSLSIFSFQVFLSFGL